MKILYFDDYKLGVLKGDTVVDVSAVVQDIPHIGPHDLINGLIERFAEYRPRSSRTPSRAAPACPLPASGFARRCPSRSTSTAWRSTTWRTARAPSRRRSTPSTSRPTAIIGPGDTMVLPDVPATIFEGEAEIAVVIGKRAKNVKAADAMNYVFGYTNFIDGSARGLPPPGNVFYQMKSRDTFAPIGPYIVTADEIRDPHKLQVRLWVNGVLKQNFNTDDMAHKIPRCIEWVSSIHTLEPGDILATGTNHRGLNSFHGRRRGRARGRGPGQAAHQRARRPQAHLGPRNSPRYAEQGRQGGDHAAADRQIRPGAGVTASASERQRSCRAMAAKAVRGERLSVPRTRCAPSP